MYNKKVKILHELFIFKMLSVFLYIFKILINTLRIKWHDTVSDDGIGL